MARAKRSTRNERRFREVARIVGLGLYDLPAFFRHGLYHLKSRGQLPDAEIIRAFARCRAWTRKAKDRMGECECCGERFPLNAMNSKCQSLWALDHDKHRRLFRGILYGPHNTEIGDGNRERKWNQAHYVDAHEARLRFEESYRVYWQNEFMTAGAAPD